MLRKFSIIILLALTFSASAQNIPTSAVETKEKQVASIPEDHQADNFLGLIIASLVLAVGFTAFAAFAKQNKEVLED